MTDEAELLQRLRNREKNSIDEAIRIYTPYLSTVLYHMAGNHCRKRILKKLWQMCLLYFGRIPGG